MTDLQDIQGSQKDAMRHANAAVRSTNAQVERMEHLEHQADDIVRGKKPMSLGSRIKIVAVLAAIAAVAVGVFFAYRALVPLPPKMIAVDNTELEEVAVVKVVDGDTLLIQHSDGEKDRLRLIGINAPESVNPDETKNTPEGAEASSIMHQLVQPGMTVWLQMDVTDHDQYGRLLRYVWIEKPNSLSDRAEVAEKMLNAILIEKGAAEAHRYYPDVLYDKLLHELMP